MQDKDGSTPLHYAAGNKQRKVAEILINEGANLMLKAKNHEIPLHK